MQSGSREGRHHRGQQKQKWPSQKSITVSHLTVPRCIQAHTCTHTSTCTYVRPYMRTHLGGSGSVCQHLLHHLSLLLRWFVVHAGLHKTIGSPNLHRLHLELQRWHCSPLVSTLSVRVVLQLILPLLPSLLPLVISVTRLLIVTQVDVYVINILLSATEVPCRATTLEATERNTADPVYAPICTSLHADPCCFRGS